MQQFQQYIGGVFSNGSATFESMDPATGTPWALMPEAQGRGCERRSQSRTRCVFCA